jgi:hypothetical protein
MNTLLLITLLATPLPPGPAPSAGPVSSAAPVPSVVQRPSVVQGPSAARSPSAVRLPSTARVPSTVRLPSAALVEVPYIEQGRAPWCAAAAAVMVMASQGHAIDLRSFVATLRVHADGIAWLDLAEGLAPQGFQAWMAPIDDTMLRNALAAGLAPVVLLRDAARPASARLTAPDAAAPDAIDDRGIHAVVLTGWHDTAWYGLAQSDLAWHSRVQRDTEWHLLDPAAPGQRSLDAATFAARSAGAAVLIRRRDGIAPPDAERWRAGDRQFRVKAWRRRAAAQVAVGAWSEGLALLDQAVALMPEDPDLQAARALLADQITRRAGQGRSRQGR